MVSFDTRVGKRILQRLEEDEVIWLTTVDAHGRPQPRPVWFHWDGEEVLILSQPQAAKLRHVRGNSRVALHFNTDEYGGDVGVILGEAHILFGPPPEARLQAYLKKYAAGIKDLGMTPDQMESEYSVALLVAPQSLRGL